MSFHAPLKKLQLKTMSPMYLLTASDKKVETNCVKNNRNLFRRIIVSMDAGRNVDIDTLLQMELSAACVYIRNLRDTNKAQVAALLAERVYRETSRN